MNKKKRNMLQNMVNNTRHGFFSGTWWVLVQKKWECTNMSIQINLW